MSSSSVIDEIFADPAIPAFLTVRQFAELAHCCEETVRRLFNSGRLPGARRQTSSRRSAILIPKGTARRYLKTLPVGGI